VDGNHCGVLSCVVEPVDPAQGRELSSGFKGEPSPALGPPHAEHHA
jgi:hypothetical protein